MTTPNSPAMPDQSRAYPTVDVVIPTYNRADLLPLAIASIQAQTVPVSRIFVVDDGSTDSTVEWVRQEALRDPRIELIEKKHGGANRARNAGIARTEAEWIAFLDSDDAWEPEKLERQFALLERNPDLIGLFSGFRLVGGAIERVHIPRDNPSVHDLRCSNALGSTSAAVLKASAVRAVGGFDPSLPSCQDWDLWFRIRREGPLGVAREPLVRFNSGPHDRITTNMDKVLAGHRAIFARLLEDVASPSERATIRAGHKLVEADIRRRFGAHRPAMLLAAQSFLQAPSKRAIAVAWRTGRAALQGGGKFRASFA